MANRENQNRTVPPPGIIERVAGTVALITGVPLAGFIGLTLLANVVDLETLEIPIIIAAAPAEIPDLGIFFPAFEIWHNKRSKRLNTDPKSHFSHRVVESLRPHYDRQLATRRAV